MTDRIGLVVDIFFVVFCSVLITLVKQDSNNIASLPGRLALLRFATPCLPMPVSQATLQDVWLAAPVGSLSPLCARGLWWSLAPFPPPRPPPPPRGGKAATARRAGARRGRRHFIRVSYAIP